MLNYFYTLLCVLAIVVKVDAQIVINEASNKNYRQIIDEDGEYNDWIELYNTSSKDVDLSGWALSDSRKTPEKWKFSNTVLAAHDFLVIQASGKDRNQIQVAKKWESAMLPTDEYSYLVPNAQTTSNWKLSTFNDSSWGKGNAGFGFADGDDRTVVPEGTIAVYIRRKFNIPDTSAIISAIFHADYDDGFIAYLNGTEIARANMNDNPQWNTLATANHEAVMYTNGNPESFEINFETLKNCMVEGQNVLCVEVHNNDASSSDLSIIPFLSFALPKDKSFFQPIPAWFSQTSLNAGLLHTNFKLSNEGEEIFLSRNAVFVDSLDIPKLQLNNSYGRTTDGAKTNGIFGTATPGLSNNSSTAYTQGYTLKPDMSQKAGFYTSAFDLTLTAYDENSTIRYTFDGSEPIETSAKYTSPIKISTTRIVKARSFSPVKLPGEVATATYFMNENFAVPVLSVTTNNSNLRGSQGIFDHIDQTWNVPSYVEYFEKNKEMGFGQWAGMQVDGGAGGSRTTGQCSFRIEPGNSTFGEGDLKYKLMPRRPNRSNFPSFYLRNGSNQYRTLPYKDALEVKALGGNTYTYYSAYHPVVVYINGSYFGLYELREKINDDYLVDNYKMNIDSLDFLGVSYFKGQKLEALRGSIVPFENDLNNFQQLNIHSADYLSKVGKFLDIQSYTDYIIAESWVGNNDWPFNNIKLFRCKGTDMKWRWAINDLEWALNPNGWTTSSFDHINYLLGQGSWSTFTGFWFNMMQTEEYKAYFINRFADLMNTSYRFAEVGPLENEMYEEMLPEIDRQSKKWGNINITTFTRNHETFRTELSKRSGFVRTHLQNHYGLKKQVTVRLEVEPEGAGSIQISTITPNNYPWEGIYFTNIPVEVTAVPNIGYQFANWNSSSFVNDVSQPTITSKFTDTEITLKATFKPVENSYGGVVISEINYKPGTDFNSPDWMEFCNLGENDVNLNGWYFSDDDSSHVSVFSQDLILAANQRLIVTNDYDSFKSLYPSTSVYTGQFNFGLGTPSDKINLYNANDSLVASVSYNDIYPWALSDNSEGRTLELRTPQKGFAEPSAWFRGCIGGSPGTAFQDCKESVVSAPVITTVNNFEINVYPVPANDFVNVDIMLDQDVDYCQIALYNLMGNKVFTKQLGNLKQGWYTEEIPLNAIRGNLLIMKVSTNRNEKSMKIVKVE